MSSRPAQVIQKKNGTKQAWSVEPAHSLPQTCFKKNQKREKKRSPNLLWFKRPKFFFFLTLHQHTHTHLFCKWEKMKQKDKGNKALNAFGFDKPLINWNPRLRTVIEKPDKNFPLQTRFGVLYKPKEWKRRPEGEATAEKRERVWNRE